MIVGLQAIPARFDVEQNRYHLPPAALEVHFQSYDTLLTHPVHTDSGGHPAQDSSGLKPGLAEAYHSSRDGRTYDVRLRRGVASAEGHELTAHDVKWSWERVFALNSWSARIARLCGVCTPDAVQVIQPYVVQVRLESPSGRFPAMLAEPFPPIYDLETVRQHCPVGDPWGDVWLRSHTAGFGPYALDDVVQSEEARLLANMHWWQGAPRERTMLLRAIAPAEDRAQALVRGNIDVAADLPHRSITAVERDPNVKVTPVPASRQIVLRIDPAFAPFGQPEVRQALALALPYQAIRKELGSAGTTDQGVPEQDHRRARTLLSEAGYVSGFRITLFIPSDDPDLQAAAQAIQRDLIRLNLKIVIESMDTGPFALEKSGRHLPVYLEERRRLTPLLTIDQLEAIPEVDAIVLAEPAASFAVRSNVEGFVRRPDGRLRYAELRKT